MENVTVYRLEAANGDGLYRGKAGRSYWERAGGVHDDAKHPFPEDDPKIGQEWCNRVSPDYYFGFASIKQAMDWVSSDMLRGLQRCGISLTIYRVPARYAMIGQTQTAFIKKKAKKITELPPTFLG
jgi:hypothetical protein